MSFLRYSLSFMSYKGVNVLLLVFVADLFIHTPSLYWELHPDPPYVYPSLNCTHTWDADRLQVGEALCAQHTDTPHTALQWL